MKKLTLLLLLFISSFSQSQVDNNKSVLMVDEPYFYQNSIGFEIRQFSKEQRLSFVLGVISAGITTIGYYSHNTFAFALGGAFALGSFTVYISSFSHLDNVSVLLNMRGVGLPKNYKYKGL